MVIEIKIDLQDEIITRIRVYQRAHVVYSGFSLRRAIEVYNQLR